MAVNNFPALVGYVFGASFHSEEGFSAVWSHNLKKSLDEIN
jgi:hypothetical protein